MDADKVYSIVGQLYTKCTLLEEELKRVRLELQVKDEQIGFLKDKSSELGSSRISNK